MLIAVGLAAPTAAHAQSTASSHLPSHPPSFSTRMADAVIARNPVAHKEWDYTAGVVLLAIDKLAEAPGVTPAQASKYRDYVKRNIDGFVQSDGGIRTYDLEEFNLDQIAEGRLLLALYARTHEQRYRKAADLLREQLRKQPRTREGGFWHKKIYPNQMWLDGIYMASPFLAEYGKLFNDTSAFNDVAKQVLLIARNTRDPKTGLYYHAWDEARSQMWADSLTGHSPHFWGRAVGWYAMALVDVLDVLPTTHRDREAIIGILREVADGVVKVQDPLTGLWYDILDAPTRAGNYHESSASSMFVYALAKGAQRGWLEARYETAARRGFDGLTRYMTSSDAQGRMSLDSIVAVSGLGGKQQRNGSYAYYISEPVVSNDFKGVGPFILASVALGH